MKDCRHFGSRAAGLLTLAASLTVPAPVQAAPPASEGAKPLPSPAAAGEPPGVLDEPEPEVELTEEEKLALRLREFKEHLERAEVAAERERWDEAVREYSAALRLLPGDPKALIGRANARKMRGPSGRCPTKALDDLLDLGKEDPRGEWLAQRAVAIEWMGECGSKFARRRLALARELAADVGSAGRPDDVRVTVARLLEEAGEAEDKTPTERAELREAALSELEKYRSECGKRGVEPTAAGLKLMADLYRQADQLSKAAQAYEDLAGLHPTAPEAKDAKGLFEELQFELELRKLDATRGFRPTEAAQAAYNRGMTATRSGEHDTAVAEFTRAVEESRWFAQAWHARGDAYARMGEFSSAVEDLKRAVRLDRSNSSAHIALGTIYMREFAAQDRAAIVALSTAVRLRPDLYQLHLLLGELYARSDRQKARYHYQRYISKAPLDDPDSRLARDALEELEREIRQEEPTPVPPPAEEALRFLDPQLQRMINAAYLRGTEYDDWGAAEKILLQARDQFASEPIVLNELARVVYHQDRPGDARQYWEGSLAMNADQVEVHERLGLLLRTQLPDDAIPHLQRAADLGSLTGRYFLAELLWEQTQPLEASEQLDLYLAEASEYDLYRARAQRLRDEMDQRFRWFFTFAGVLLVVGITIPSWRIWRHYRGASLRQLLERDPKSFPEVARILSLIRHEILKHNTAFLADVGTALEMDAPDAEQRVAVLSRRLFGDGDASDGRGGSDPNEGREGIYGRFYGYLEELDKVGRAHRVALNLRRKDPIFRPMIQAFDDLAAAAPRLRKVESLRGGRRLDLAKRLEQAGHVLGRQAFERLSDLIRELCVTNVDAKIIDTVYHRVVGEKQFAGREIAPLAIAGTGAPVRIFRTDLEDILTNVFRNSLRSSVLYAPPPVGIAVDLDTEVDDITGLESIAIRIKDRSPEQLSNEMLRGRYVERGMGITVDLLSRYDGAIGVEPEPGWSKAVVLRFFMLENDTSSVAAEAAQ